MKYMIILIYTIKLYLEVRYHALVQSSVHAPTCKKLIGPSELNLSSLIIVKTDW